MIPPTRADVVLPVRNGERYIREAILSLLQDDQYIDQLIIIDDGSDDETLRVLNDMSLSVPTKIITQRPLGLVAALNRGISAARAPFIARMDSDDIWLKGKLPAQLKFLDMNPDVALVGTQVAHIDSLGGSLGYSSAYSTKPDKIRSDLMQRGKCVFAHSSVVIRRRAIEQAGGYRAEFEFAEDFDLWLRLAETYDLANLPDVHVHYRRHPDAVSEKYSQRQSYSRDFALFCSRHRRSKGVDPSNKIHLRDYPDLVELKLAHETIILLNHNRSHFASAEGLQAIMNSARNGYLGQERRKRYRLMKATAKELLLRRNWVAALHAYLSLAGRRLLESKFYR